MAESPDELSAHAYFQRIESLFIGLRGAPLLLPPADYRVTQRWHRLGIPLRLVEEQLRSLFAERREQLAAGKSGSAEKINSLRYWRSIIESAWKEEQALVETASPAGEARIDVARRLAGLADALPVDLPEREGWQTRLRALTGDAEAVEAALTVLDGELLAAGRARAADDPEVASRLARATQRLGERLTGAELKAARGRLEVELVREQLGLPLLSLFSPEALAADA